MHEETEPRYPKDSALHKPVVAVVAAALEQLVVVDATAVEVADTADDDAAVVQTTPFADADGWNS